MPEILTSLFNAVLKSGTIPQEWKTKQIVPLYKRGGQADLNNYRPIAVACTYNRVFASIIASRLSSYLHEGPVVARLQDAQFGFRKEMSTEQAHLVLLTCAETALAGNEPLALVRLDISKAYDRVSRELLWQVLAEDQYPQSFIALKKEMYMEVPCSWGHGSPPM